jgi:hypothetical protein
MLVVLAQMLGFKQCNKNVVLFNHFTTFFVF